MVKSPISLDDVFLGDEEEQNYREPTQSDLNDELISYLACCGSCVNFEHYRGEAGFCIISDNNCICVKPSAMIDLWDKKCEKWSINPRVIEDIKRSDSGYTCPYCEQISQLKPIAKTKVEFTDRNGENQYIWDELHKCDRCGNLYILENGT